jgi:uncharacterized protein
METEGPGELGIGVVYTPGLARVLDLGSVDVLEIEPQMSWRATGDPNDPICIDFELFSRLREMPQHKLVHSVTLPVGNSRPHDRRELEQLARSVALLDAPYASEHLSFNRCDVGSQRHWTGFLLPPKQDESAVETAAARIDEMRRAVAVPVAFETGVNYLRPQEDELPDGRFMRRVAEAADCGILLDLHNLLTNERNGRASLRDVFDEIPHERVWEIHLAGGMDYRSFWLDSHSGHIEDELFSAARAVVDECPNLRAIIFEILDQHVDDRSREALVEDVQRLRSLWVGRRRLRPAPMRRPAEHRRPESASVTTVQRREETLGALALGRAPLDPDPVVANDPAASLYADLVASMREGVLYETLPLLLRLLFYSIGTSATMDLISEYRANCAPQIFGADEARRFLLYVRERDLAVAHIAEILDFEDALLAVTGPDEERVVTFECDPAVLLTALAERKAPGLLARERFYVHVSKEGIKIRQ